MSLGRLGGAYAALHAGHMVGDWWVQTERQSQVKGKPGWDGRAACAAHVATLTATQAAFLGMACAASRERLPMRRVAAGLAVNAVSHYVMDRCDHGIMPALTSALSRWGAEDFAASGDGLASGAKHLDQAWHVGWCCISAAIIAGQGREARP